MADVTKHKISVLNRMGHTETLWPATVVTEADAAEVETARVVFDRLMASGATAFAVDIPGQKDVMLPRVDGRQVFDPTLPHTMFIPAVQGG